jgi:predicted DNA binding CopG/RHH family protein
VAFTLRIKDRPRLIRLVTARYMHAEEIAAYEKRVPRLKTDRQAEAFLAQDLSELDFSQFKPARFEFEKKDSQINMRVPKPLLVAVKARAKTRGIPYTRFIRETLEQAITNPK